MNRRQIFTAPIIGGGGAVKPIAGGLWYGWMPSNIEGDGTVALDKIGTLTDANYVDNACLLFTGPETLTVPGLAAGTPVENELVVLGADEVVNGTFDTDLSGWADASTGDGAASWDSGRAKLIRNTGTSNRGVLEQSTLGTSGSTYLIRAETSPDSTGKAFVTVNGPVVLTFPVSGGVLEATFVSDGSDSIRLLPGDDSTIVYFDNISVREVISGAIPTAETGEISFAAGLCGALTIDDVLTYTCAEVTGTTVYDITGASNDATLSTDTVRSTSDDATPWQIREGFSRPSDLYIATEPAGGWDRTFDPTGALNKEIVSNALATLIEDATGTAGTWTVTEPSGGWQRTYNPNVASLQTMADVIATLANDLPTTVEAYTLTAPTANVYTFDPVTSSTYDMYDVLATLLIDLQTYGIIG